MLPSRFLAPLVAVLAACASPAHGPAHGRAHPPVWSLAELDRVDMHALGYDDGSGELRWLPVESLRSAARAYSRLLAANPGSGAQPILLGVPQPNAMAFVEAGEPVIAVTAGMVELLADDEAAWAALFGHELAHLRLGHSARRIEREAELRRGSSLAAILLTLVGMPFATLVADGAGEVAGRQFSRDDERDADMAGMAYAVRAGYSADGVARLFERLGGAGVGSGLTLLSTHPAIDERVKAARAAQSGEGADAR